MLKKDKGRDKTTKTNDQTKPGHVKQSKTNRKSQLIINISFL